MGLDALELHVSQAKRAKLALAYVAMLVLIAGLWVADGEWIGSVAGGVFFAMLVCLPAYVGVTSAPVSSIWTACSMVLAMHLGTYRNNFAFDMDWEPPHNETALNVIGFAAALLASGLVAALRSAAKERRQRTPAQSALRGMLQENRSLLLPTSKLRTVGFTIMCLAVLCSFLATETRFVSTPRLAATRYIFDNVYSFEERKGLAYTLASRTDAHIEAISRSGDKASAQVRIATPTIPFELRPGEAETTSARRRWLSLGDGERAYAETVLTLQMQRTGFAGWSVTNPEDEGDVMRIARTAPAATRRPDDSRRFLNTFMALDAASRPTHPLILASMILGIGFIGLGRTASQVLSGIAMSLTPIAMFLLGILAMSSPA